MAKSGTYTNPQLPKWADDPDFREAYEGLSSEDLRIVNSIAADIPGKIAFRVSPAPFFYRYFYQIGLSTIAGIAICTWALLPPSREQMASVHPTSSEQVTPPSQTNTLAPVNSDDDKEDDIHKELKKSTPEEDLAGKTSKNPLENKEPKEVVLPNANEKIQDDLAKTKEKEKEKEKTEDLTVKKPSDNSRQLDPNQIVTLRVTNVMVLSKTALADVNNNKNDRNKDVTNHEIGQATVTKSKNNNYSLDDLVHYQSGDQGFSSYLTRHLNNRIDVRRSSAKKEAMVQFDVTAKGHVENILLIGEYPAPMEDMIKKVLSESTGWESGKASGKKGAIQMMVVIQFAW
jgi:hypothetical protein